MNNAQILEKLVELLDQVNCDTIKNAATSTLQQLQFHSANVEEWSRIQLKVRNAPTLPPWD